MNITSRLSLLLSVLLCVVVFYFGTTAYGFQITVLTEDFAPFNYVENGKVTGFTTEIVQELIKRTGIGIERDKILLWPWKRAYKTALEKENVLLFTTTRTPERDKLFKWVGPIYPREQWIFKLKSRMDIQVNNFEEAREYKVVEVENSANFLSFIKHGFVPEKNLIIVNTWNSKINMLLANRVELASFIPLEMAFRLRQLGKSYTLVEKQFLASGDFEYYLSFSRRTPDSIVNRFQKAYENMKQEGLYSDILNKYMK